ncbi:hypothetical protein NW754_001434 [Fusarium falciforme]|uniref:DUF1993 domain-containing protein n=1 Tax=Fusarium falciforme TaxID=195108 RepID=A0A9W8QQN9_9HYPO|nr:hypothetical protein NW754_001434 [Fusarium falciforme]KAJ4175622.1 hypothetical protein NW755_014835 [Fusarium falciforme]KAJ4176184.1 hypothetical protein NW767_015533 [Fusarium falciforme]KAJ4177386.1 hypothetical protein NW759_017436 [Fusarium solani]KAJ4213917.1 hypothetical protein NW757_014741 [Fusarium falciforme]
MSYSLYNSAIDLAKGSLVSLSQLLKTAEAQPDASSLLSARLHGNMLPLTFQVFMVTDLSQKIAAHTTGTEPLTLDANLTTFESMQARIQQVLEIIGKVDEKLVNSLETETRTVSLDPATKVQLKSRDYVNGYALPNVFFHLSMAYAILRKENVPIGKRDYLGSFLGKYLA